MINDSAIILARITYGTKIRNQRTSLHKIAKQLMDTFSAMQFLCRVLITLLTMEYHL